MAAWGRGVRRPERGEGMRRLGLGKEMKTWRGRRGDSEGGDEETWAREGVAKTGFGEGNEDMAREVTC